MTHVLPDYMKNFIAKVKALPTQEHIDKVFESLSRPPAATAHPLVKPLGFAVSAVAIATIAYCMYDNHNKKARWADSVKPLSDGAASVAAQR